MLAYEEALSTVLANTPVLAPCRIPLKDLLGHYLAEDVVAPFDVPRFTNSSVDGCAVRVADLAAASTRNPALLRIAGAIRAGDSARLESESGSAVKVFTGSPLPVQSEAVVMKEHTELRDGHVAICCTTFAGENIRPQGAEFREGQTVLAAGTRITPPVIGVLSSLGFASAAAHRRPRVALIITGNELVQPGTLLRDAQIYDSNSAALTAAISLLPVEVVQVTQVTDDLSIIKREVGRALKCADVIISVGGASAGDYDYAKQAFTDNGVKVLFISVAMKPGKPTIFGTNSHAEDPQLVFGLPGNPVSALVCFHQLIMPAIHKMLGASEIVAPRIEAVLGSNLKKAPGRLEFVRGHLINQQGTWIAHATSGQESHMLGGIADADVLIHFPADASALHAGQTVTVERLTW